MAKKESQLDHYEHSEIKIKLLRKYLEAYLNVIGQSPFFDVINIYDLFCGEGIYPNGGKGSPIIITEAVDNIVSQSTNQNLKSTQFNFTANDKDANSYNSVKSYLMNQSSSLNWLGSLNIYNRDYKEFIPELSEKFPKLKREKAFVFIDPYGYSDISVKDIQSLLKGGNSEVLLFLPTQFMYRFANQATPPSLVRFIGELDPNDTWGQCKDGLEFIENLKNGFKAQLPGYYVDTFIIAKARNEYFCMFFFTSNIFGFQKMLEAKWSIDEEGGRGWVPSSYIPGGAQTSMFSEQAPVANTFSLEKNLKNFISVWRSNGEIYQYILHLGFLPKHVTPILKQLFSIDVIEVVRFDGITSSLRSFFLTYRDWKEAPKIKIKYKGLG